jgi:uncharacterized protein involved in copper resistance
MVADHHSRPRMSLASEMVGPVDPAPPNRSPEDDAVEAAGDHGGDVVLEDLDSHFQSPFSSLCRFDRHAMKLADDKKAVNNKNAAWF